MTPTNISYYKDVTPADKDSSKANSGYDKFNKGMMVISGLVGLISLIVLIALNITNLSINVGDKGGISKFEKEIEHIKNTEETILSDLTGNIKPRLALITSATGYNLPSMITAATRLIQNDIYQFCTPAVENPTGACPVILNPRHDSLFQLYDNENKIECNISKARLVQAESLRPIPFASFIPTPTTLEGCIRFPSFSLGATVYSYTHNILHRYCRDDASSSQYWSVGKITAGQNYTPVFKEIVNWYINDGLNRKYCSTTAAKYGAWLLCSIVTKHQEEDFSDTDVDNLFLGYMDVFGNRRAWYYSFENINADKKYSALFTSVGSGIILNGKVMFLIYGGLSQAESFGAYCTAPQCSNPDQNTCNQAQRPGQYSNKQGVNAIISFTDSTESQPVLHLQTISPDQIPLGSEGRLYYNTYTNKTYVYIKSASWHSLLLFGEIKFTDEIKIDFFDYLTMSRPSADPCSSANRCPKVCVGGVYTDFFLLSAEQKTGITLMLTGGKIRRAPQIRVADVDNIYITVNLGNQIQEAGYTTTTCFRYKDKIWCINIYEVSPGSIGKTEIVSIMYPLPGQCFPAGINGNLANIENTTPLPLLPNPKTPDIVQND